MRPYCSISVCVGEKVPAVFVAPQVDEAIVSWVPICETHADGWFEDSDTPEEDQTLYRLEERRG